MSNPTQNQRPFPKVLDWLRYLCAFLLFMYGMSKLAHLQFNLAAQLAPRPIGSLNGYELTWFYYGYSRVYACILGLTQVFGATLLLFRNTTLLGAVLMLPVMANIVLINVFILRDDYGPYFNSVLIFTSLLIILWHHRRALIDLFWTSQQAEPPGSRRLHGSIQIGILLLVSAIMLTGIIAQHFVRR
jgi:hypothetical protein